MDPNAARLERLRRKAWESISGVDATRLVHLLATTIAPPDDFEKKQKVLMDGLQDLIGADAWTAQIWNEEILTDESNKPLVKVHSRPAIVSTKRLPQGEVWAICLFRHQGKPAFTHREERLARIVLEEIPWLYEARGSHPIPLPEPNLPPRERQILQLLKNGWDRKRIAAELSLSPSTVADYQKKIYRKLGVRTQIALMRNFPERPAPPP